MRRIIGFALIAAAIVLASCDLQGNKDVTMLMRSSSGASPANYTLKAVVAAGIEFSAFSLSIRDVEFKQDENDPDSPLEVYFTGPYELSLLESAGPLEQTIGSAEIPAGTYQEVRFKLHKSTANEPGSDLYDRSIYLEGTINETPFEMWHDNSENLDVGKATGIVVGEGPLEITVDFDLSTFLDQTANGGHLIDLSTAEDGNLDGLIEISPQSDDGTINRDLADELKDNIKLAADFL